MSEEEKKADAGEKNPDSKRDFLKALGVGMGLAGLASVMGGQAMAQSEKKNKYVIVITHGGNG